MAHSIIFSKKKKSEAYFAEIAIFYWKIEMTNNCFFNCKP